MNKPATLSCCAAFALALFGCATPETLPTVEAGPAMDYLEAYQTVEVETARALKGSYHCARNTMSKMYEAPTNYSMDRDGLTVECNMTTGLTSMGPGKLRFIFARTPRPDIVKSSQGLWLSAVEESSGRMSILGMDLNEQTRAQRLAAAWRALGNPPAEEPVDLAGVAPLVELPQQAQRFKIEAELAVREKRFFDAALAYRKGLAQAPGWAVGRFNSALVLAECGFHREAAAEMKRYLSLRPDAPNARAAQNQIYEWEAKAKQRP